MDADRVTRLRGVIGRLARQLNASSTGEGLTPSQASVLGKDVDQRVKAQRAAVVSECVDQLPAEQEQALVNALPALEALAEALKKSTRQPAR